MYENAQSPGGDPHNSGRAVGVPLLHLAATIVPLALAGCGFEPQGARIEYALNEKTTAAVAELVAAGEITRSQADAFEAQLGGALEMLFGTPEGPGFLRTAEWIDDDFDPNFPSYPADDLGSGEISEEDWGAIVAGNEERFARELKLLAEGEFERIGPLKSKPELQRNWDELLAAREDAENQDEWLAQARALFTEYYPKLADSADLYREQCLHCHGPSGGGDGPTAQFLDPLPRDYRKGIFKFTAVKDKARPRRADLYRILDEGVTSTAMPSFRRFSPAELHGLVDYVRLLALRGEVENELLAIWQAEDYTLSPDLILDTYSGAWEKWNSAAEKLIVFDGDVPEATPELIARGRELYNDSVRGNCASCHGPRGLGDGSAALKVDEHGHYIRENGKLASAYQDDWGHAIYPRNLTQGIYRGGGRPIDLYRRIYAGINGTPMPALGGARDAQGELVVSDEDIWALVYYAKSLGEGAWERHPLVAANGGHAAGHGEVTHDGGGAHGAPAAHGDSSHGSGH